jgi:hypothetical protein
MSKSDDPNNWRELCAAAAVEEDSAKLAGLVEQIIRTLDKDRAASRLVSTSANSAPSQVMNQR